MPSWAQNLRPDSGVQRAATRCHQLSASCPLSAVCDRSRGSRPATSEIQGPRQASDSSAAFRSEVPAEFSACRPGLTRPAAPGRAPPHKRHQYHDCGMPRMEALRSRGPPPNGDLVHRTSRDAGLRLGLWTGEPHMISPWSTRRRLALAAAVALLLGGTALL